MNYKKPEWNKGRVCSKCGKRFYATSKQSHNICPKCLIEDYTYRGFCSKRNYEKMKGNKAND